MPWVGNRALGREFVPWVASSRTGSGIVHRVRNRYICAPIPTQRRQPTQNRAVAHGGWYLRPSTTVAS